ncbi:hypothetical protein SAMN05421820_112217 [Pedobacter steynii]|uniref:Uncharacterized protein n=1 Tax=Pedobacter steynii TaxID=430522 RepID=A0A1H0HPQ0_9SPHI|nr:hypothetical protein SAMN05421820_112217 [Pedobacter steynii]
MSNSVQRVDKYDRLLTTYVHESRSQTLYLLLQSSLINHIQIFS